MRKKHWTEWHGVSVISSAFSWSMAPGLQSRVQPLRPTEGVGPSLEPVPASAPTTERLPACWYRSPAVFGAPCSCRICRGARWQAASKKPCGGSLPCRRNRLWRHGGQNLKPKVVGWWSGACADATLWPSKWRSTGLPKMRLCI